MVIKSERPFYESIISELNELIRFNESAYPKNELFRIDLHCHDHNSNVPDEQLGRILNVPETWLPTDSLMQTLQKHGMDSVTITNHNNARSCFELLDKGHDILVGAEFSCLVPDFQVGIHVLTYGFNVSQEETLNKLRKNLYAFLEYTRLNDIPTIWAHPLYFYKKNGTPPMDFFNKMALMFERFEVLNGQRDTWQNMLVKRWVESLTEKKIHEISKSQGIDPGRYCSHPFKKSMSGGSDSHMGIFSGLTGTKLYTPDFEERRKHTKLSDLALEAIRAGRMVAYGGHNNSEKMMIALLDYFCQIALNGKDPGLLRILLHKGDTRQKITALLVANGFAELRQHKVTMKFINLFHESLTGIEPHFTKRWLIPKIYKPIFLQTKEIAQSFNTKSESSAEIYKNSISRIYINLVSILADRIISKTEKLNKNIQTEEFDLDYILANLELPSEIRSFLGTGKKNGNLISAGKKQQDVARFLDGLSFPFLASSVILSAHFVSARVLYNNRSLLNTFSESLNCLRHPKRMLWLSDTWNDNNGVSMVLKSMLDAIRNRNLPIDIMVCSKNLQSEDHLIVIKPIAELKVPFYHEQDVRIPDYLEIHHKFLEGEYDRVMCSTEGPMGLAGLYLKHAYSVPASFFIHTDWLTFSKKVLNLKKENHARFRRLLRAYYKAFDSVFVLNTEHYNWLINKKMELNKTSVFLTAHWPAPQFRKLDPAKKQLFNFEENQKVMLYTGRISLEKGIMELPAIYKTVKASFPGIKLVIVGSGPAEPQLKEALPDAIYKGWVEPSELPAIYSSADLLLLPSKFDTFSCVVLESLKCGLPVVAYNTMGPKDIIQHKVNGLLASNPIDMAHQIIHYFNNPGLMEEMKIAAIKRADDYTDDKIIHKLLQDTGLTKDS